MILGTHCKDKEIKYSTLAYMSRSLEKIVDKSETFQKLKSVLNANDKLMFFPRDNSLGIKNDVYLEPIKKRLNN